MLFLLIIYTFDAREWLQWQNNISCTYKSEEKLSIFTFINPYAVYPVSSDTSRRSRDSTCTNKSIFSRTKGDIKNFYLIFSTNFYLLNHPILACVSSENKYNISIKLKGWTPRGIFYSFRYTEKVLLRLYIQLYWSKISTEKCCYYVRFKTVALKSADCCSLWRSRGSSR